jgi:nicotinamidase-related amidase
LSPEFLLLSLQSKKNIGSKKMKTCLFVVDVQNGFVGVNTTHVIERITSLIETELFDTVIFTKFLNTPGSPYVNFLGWKRLFSKEETDLAEPLKPFAKVIFEKNIYTGVNPEVLSFLESQDISVAFVCGIDTDCCVLETAVDLFENNIHPYVLAHYSASNGGEQSHKAAIAVLNRLIGKKNIIYSELNHGAFATYTRACKNT